MVAEQGKSDGVNKSDCLSERNNPIDEDSCNELGVGVEIGNVYMLKRKNKTNTKMKEKEKKTRQNKKETMKTKASTSSTKCRQLTQDSRREIVYAGAFVPLIASS